MSNQKRKLNLIPVKGGESTHIEIELYYSKGGMNYFNGRNEARGLYISVQPITRTDRCVSFMAFSGIKQHVKEMKMFTQKSFDSFEPDATLIQQMIDHVLQKNNLTLLEDSMVVR